VLIFSLYSRHSLCVFCCSVSLTWAISRTEKLDIFGFQGKCLWVRVSKKRINNGRYVGLHVYLCIDQTWQKRYLVLRDSWTDDSDTSLELYACSDTDSCKCHTVSLRHVMLVDVYHDSKSFPHAFIVFRSVDSLTAALPATV